MRRWLAGGFVAAMVAGVAVMPAVTSAAGSSCALDPYERSKSHEDERSKGDLREIYLAESDGVWKWQPKGDNIICGAHIETWSGDRLKLDTTRDGGSYDTSVRSFRKLVVQARRPLSSSGSSGGSGSSGSGSEYSCDDPLFEHGHTVSGDTRGSKYASSKLSAETVKPVHSEEYSVQKFEWERKPGYVICRVKLLRFDGTGTRSVPTGLRSGRFEQRIEYFEDNSYHVLQVYLRRQKG